MHGIGDEKPRDRRKSLDRAVVSKDYDNAYAVADCLEGRSQLRMPSSLIAIGYWDATSNPQSPMR